MRIFINNDMSKMGKSIEKYLINTRYETFVYSKEGIFKIDYANIYKLNIEDKKCQVYEKYYNNMSVIVDESYNKQEIVNQLPIDHVLLLKKINTYVLDKQSNIKFIIEFNSSIDKIIDNYFEVPDNTKIYDKMFQENFIEFLSVLY